MLIPNANPAPMQTQFSFPNPIPLIPKSNAAINPKSNAIYESSPEKRLKNSLEQIKLQKLINRSLGAKQLLLLQLNSLIPSIPRIKLINPVIPLTLYLRTENRFNYRSSASKCSIGSRIEISSLTRCRVRIRVTEDFATAESEVDIVVAADVNDEIA